MRLCSIASGSSGNCIYTGTDDTHLLVDAGVSAKKIEAGLKDLELEPFRHTVYRRSRPSPRSRLLDSHP